MDASASAADGPLMAHRSPAVIASAGQDGEQGFNPDTSFRPIDPDDVALPTNDPYVNEIVHFARCCEDGAEPISGGRDNIETMKLVFGIYESSRTGQAVELSQL